MADTGIGGTVQALTAARREWRARQDARRDVNRFPSRHQLALAIDLLSAALYPRRLGGFRGRPEDEDTFVAAKLIAAAGVLEQEVAAELGYWEGEARDVAFDPEQPATIVRLFLAGLGEVRGLIDSDVDAAFTGDPAARSVDEVLVCYPGAIASLHHRLAHPLHMLGAPIAARIVSELANERTGIDIHPGATIGRGFFIDHGTGVVIGETAILGARVRLYQHVTLGAVARDEGDGAARQLDRHPILEDDVTVYAGATILGRVTIGRGTVIAGNVWLLEDVPAHSVVVQPEPRLFAQEDGWSLAPERDA